MEVEDRTTTFVFPLSLVAFCQGPDGIGSIIGSFHVLHGNFQFFYPLVLRLKYIFLLDQQQI